MELRPWRLLPDEMRTKEVRKYYNVLMKHRMWLKVKRAFDVVVAGIMLAVLIIPMGIIALAIRLDSPLRHWNIAECSLSTGYILTLHSLARLIII